MAEKLITAPSGMTQQELENFVRCSRDPFYFSQFIRIIHPIQGKVDFDLYDYQKIVLYYFLKYRFNIVLKFRQAGLTELIAMYCLWLALFFYNKNIQIISIKDRVAKRVLRRIRYMYKNLPWYLKVPIVNGRPSDLGTQCITPDTILRGSIDDFPIGDIIPFYPGIMDVSHMGLKILTHKGTFEKVVRTFNKGYLETWEIKNEKGQILKCTPDHRLYTISGWKSVREIIDQNLDCIFWDTQYLDNLKVPEINPPKTEIIKETRFRGYFVSNLGKVYSKNGLSSNKLKLMKTRISNGERVKLKGEGNNKHYHIHRLVWETFKGNIPEDMVIDHINCNRLDNNLNNLQLISQSENIKRAYKFNRTIIQNNYRLTSISLKKLGKLKSLVNSLGSKSYGNGVIIAKELNLTTKKVSHYTRGKTGNNIYISKVKVIRKLTELICDLEVENNHSYITKSNYINHNSELEFSNGSTITSIPTTEEAGRSEAVSLLVIDEAAIVKWANQIWAAAFPTLACLSYETPIFIEKRVEIRKGHSRPLIEKVEIGSICPKEVGIEDISHLNLKTLSHKGIWQKVLFSQNKGKLETWEVKDCRGKTIKATPAHRFYTRFGWKTLKYILDNDIDIIQVDTGIDNLKENPITIPPESLELRPINGFENYFVSNMGKVFKSKKGVLTEISQRLNKDGYLRVILTNGTKRNVGNSKNQIKNKSFQHSVHRLVYETFIGSIPDNYEIDHINCKRSDNYVTNLRILTKSENTKRSFKYTLSATLSPIMGDRLPDLIKRANILFLSREGYTYNQISKIVYPDSKQGKKFVKRILTERGSRVYLSKLKVVNKTHEFIYDIHVENDHSFISANNFVNHNTGGSAILNSTPFGIGNLFHKTWVDAVANGNSFNPIRLNWRMHPDRDEAWYKTMADALGPRRTAQEIDGDFLTSGNSVFDLVDIKAIEDSLSEVEPFKIEMNGSLVRIHPPKRNCKNYIGADVSSGRSRDYSSFSNMDRQGKEISYFKGKIGVGPFADLLMKEGKLNNFAVIAPESNDIGLAVTTKIQEHGYPNLYYTTQFLKEKGSSKPKTEKLPGWYTTSKTRPIIIEELEADIRNDVIETYDKFFVQEAYTFIYDESNRPVAMGKGNGGGEDIFDEDGGSYTDDSILAKAITNHIRKGKMTSVVVAPQ